MRIASAFNVLAALLLFAHAAAAEVVRVDVQRRDDFGSHTRVIARVHFAVDPTAAANQRLTDLALAPRNASGMVEFSSDLLFFAPKSPASARGTVFLEIVNRGRDQSLALMSDARQRSFSPESWDMGDRFLLERGFTVAFLGWQFDVTRQQGLTFTAPRTPAQGIVRASYVEAGGANGPRYGAFAVAYCASDPGQRDATLSFRTRIDGEPQIVPRETWQFGPDGCSVRLPSGFQAGLYEAVYRAEGSAVAGLGLAAARDFASYLKFGAPGVAVLREDPRLTQRVVGFGYSQSGRFLREFVRDGFNQDERGRAAFDGLMIASAGAGGGSFNHRFAQPGQAGNSVLSILRPVDLPPFSDDGLLAKARAARVTPRIFYTFSSTEYWARAGSLTHTSEDGRVDVPLDSSSRLYFLTGTPHSSGPLPLLRDTGAQAFRYDMNFAEQKWVLRALLLNMDEWIRTGAPPPASRYPTIARRELVPPESVHFPAVPSFPVPDYMPRVWRMNYGADYDSTRVITQEPPNLGSPYPVLVPQVNADGNEVGGVLLPEVAVPLGTHTGWNITVPQLRDLGYLAGLVGSFVPFTMTREARMQTGDTRRSIEERYDSRRAYMDDVRRATQSLVRERFILADDVPAVMRDAEARWNVLVAR